MNGKITTRQLSLLIISGFFLTKIHVLPALMAGYVGESLCIPIIINFALDFLLLLLILPLIKDNETFLTLQQTAFGEKGGKVVSFLYFLFFMIKAFVPIFEQDSAIELTFYETQPLIIIFLPFFIVALFFIIKGYKAVIRSIEFCFPLFLISIGIIFFLSFGEANFSSLLPVFSKSPKTLFKSAFLTLTWFGDPIYILFLAGQIKKSKNFNKSVFVSYAICISLTVVLFALFYSVFDSIAERQYFATLKMSKYSLTLSNIGRFDYISSMALILSSIFITTLPLIFASCSLNDCFSFKNKFVAPIIVVAIQIITSFVTEYHFLYSIQFVSKYLVYFLIIMTYVIPLIIFLKTKRSKNV